MNCGLYLRSPVRIWTAEPNSVIEISRGFPQSLSVDALTIPGRYLPYSLQYTVHDHPLSCFEFESRQRLGILLFTTAIRQALRPTQPRIQWAPGALSVGVKRPGRESDHLPPSSAEVKNA
jgi:hypothetical protein